MLETVGLDWVRHAQITKMIVNLNERGSVVFMKTPDQVRLFVLRSKKEQKVIPLTMDSASWMGIFNCSQLKS